MNGGNTEFATPNFQAVTKSKNIIKRDSGGSFSGGVKYPWLTKHVAVQSAEMGRSAHPHPRYLDWPQLM